MPKWIAQFPLNCVARLRHLQVQLNQPLPRLPLASLSHQALNSFSPQSTNTELVRQYPRSCSSQPSWVLSFSFREGVPNWRLNRSLYCRSRTEAPKRIRNTCPMDLQNRSFIVFHNCQI